MHDVIDSLEILYQDAKASVCTVDTKSQRQQLALSYLRSLVRRIDARLLARETERDEIAVALCGRARPVFGFVIDETLDHLVQGRSTPASASIHLSGACRNTFALRGETSFGTQAACHSCSHFQKVGVVPMVGERDCC